MGIWMNWWLRAQEIREYRTWLFAHGTDQGRRPSKVGMGVAVGGPGDHQQVRIDGGSKAAKDSKTN
jgi:hypothetical protein